MKRVLIVMALLSASLAHFRAHPETQTLTQRYADVSISELSSKTVKRMLVSNDGKMLYILAHDSDGLSNPIVLIYDHANKTVLRQLDLSNCATGTYVISKLSDIAVTSDGSLAGCNRYKNTVDRSTTGSTITFYTWAMDSNGYPSDVLGGNTVGAIKMGYSSSTGNYYYNDVGQTCSYVGTNENGSMYVSCASAASDGDSQRFVRYNIVYNGGWPATTTKVYHTYQVAAYAPSKTGNIQITALANESLALSSEKLAPAQLTLSTTSGTAYTAASTSSFSRTVRSKHVFSYGGSKYMVSPSTTGFELANITSSLSGASKVTVSATALSSNTTTNCAAAGTSLTEDGATRMGLFMLRDGKLSKYTTSVPKITASQSSLSITAPHNGTSPTVSFTVSAADLSADLTVAANPGSITVTKGSDWNARTGGTVYVSLNTAYDYGSISGNVYISSSGATTVTIPVSAEITAVPTITASESSLEISAPHNGTSPVKSFTVTGSDLSADMNVRSNAASIIVTTGSDWNARTGGTVNVSLDTSNAIGALTGGYVYISATGASQVSIPVTASITANPYINLSTESIDFEMTEGDTPPTVAVTVSAGDLTNGMTHNPATGNLSVAEGDDWNSLTGGTLYLTPKAGLAAGSYSGTYYYVAVQSGSTRKTVSFTITVNKRSIPTVAAAVDLSLIQPKVDDKYSFNVEMDLAVNSGCLSRSLKDSYTVGSAMDSYVAVVDADTYSRLATATSVDIDGAAQTSTFTQATADINLGNGLTVPAGGYYWRIPLSAGEGDTRKLSVVWHNVVPTAAVSNGAATSALLSDASLAPYAVDVYLAPADSFLDLWANANLSGSQASADVLAPAPYLSLSQIDLRKDDSGRAYADTDDNSWQPSGAVVDVYDADGNKTGTRAVNPVMFDGLNVFVADGTIGALPVTDEVLQNNTITYQMAVVKQGTQVTYGGDNLFTVGADDAASIAASGSAVTMSVPADGDITADATYTGHIFAAYSAQRYPATVVNAADAADELGFSVSFGRPSVSISGTPAFAKYEDLYWNGETTESLGYFARVAVDLGISFPDNFPDLYTYVGFDARQSACAASDGKGCYATDDLDALGNPMWKHSFAGTRAANGGAPLNFDFGDIKAISHAGVKYVEYDPTALAANQTWADIYEPANNWSRLAIDDQRLAIHVNPAFRYADQDAFTAGRLSGSLNIGVNLVVPVDGSDYYILGSGGRGSKTRRKAASLVNIVGSLVTDTEVETVDLSRADIVTGLDQVAADSDAAPVYYNLQGIRVNNPAPGQIYIVVRGRQVTKLLIK